MHDGSGRGERICEALRSATNEWGGNTAVAEKLFPSILILLPKTRSKTLGRDDRTAFIDGARVPSVRTVLAQLKRSICVAQDEGHDHETTTILSFVACARQG